MTDQPRTTTKPKLKVSANKNQRWRVEDLFKEVQRQATLNLLQFQIPAAKSDSAVIRKINSKDRKT